MVSVLARILLLVAVVVGAASPAFAEKRVALIIGNANYASTPALANPRNDAEDIAKLLRELGFEVLLELDIDKRGMDLAFARFARAAQDADAALFYYAGHGIQREGRNFLMPVDAKVEDDISIRFEMVGLDAARDALAGVPGLKIMVIDACRNNPVAERLQSRAASRGAMFNLGLANEQVRGMVVVYATQPNNVAADGAGRNSPFTLAFMEQAREPGLRVADMLTRVADSVSRATSGRQVPEFTASGGGQFVLNLRETDTQIWQRVREGSREQVAAFLNDYPRSVHAEDARLRLETMDRPSADPAERRARTEAEAAARAALAEQNARLEQLQQQLAAMQQEMERRSREAGQANERARVAVGRRARERERAEQATARAQQERLQRTRDAAEREAEARLARERRLAERAEAREADARRAREREAAAQATIRELEERLRSEREAAAQVAARQAEARARRERDAAAQIAARQAEERSRREREAAAQTLIREAEERSRRERVAAASSTAPDMRSGTGAGTGVAAASPVQGEMRLALVLGVGSYRSNPLPNALNNAGLMAQTLRDLGFSTVEGADLPQAELRTAIANFMAKARQAGPDATVLVYFAGLGLQHEGDSYLIPSDALIERESDVPIMGVRLVDVTRALSSVQGRARLLLLDLSAEHPWASLGLPVRRGVGVIDAGPGLLIASAAAASEVVAPFGGAYGRFALALVEQLRAPGVPLDEAIARARLRVHQQSNGRDTPWEASRLPPPVRSLTLPADPTPTGTTLPPLAARRIAGLSVEEAYALAIERDSITAYQEFLWAHPGGPFTRRVQRLLAARREALVWRQTLRIGSPPAYWTYLRRYARGPHAEEARWRLGRLQVPATPSQGFVEVAYEDIPPPLPGVEIVDDPMFWAPAPAAFYDELVLAPVTLGPPPARIWALPPPRAYPWGVLPVAAAAIVGAPFILPRTLRRPEMPVVLRPPPGGPHLLPRPGGPGSGRPALGALGGTGRPLPGAPGGGQLPRPAGGPVVQQPVVQHPLVQPPLVRRRGASFIEDNGRPAGRPGMRRPGRPFGPVMQQSRRPAFEPRPRSQRAEVRPSRPVISRTAPSRPVFRPSGPSRPLMGGRRR